MHQQLDHLRRKIAVCFASVLLIWPMFHMTWANVYGLNATKLSGWGMYSVPRPRLIGVTVIRLEDKVENVPLAGLGRVVGAEQLLSFRGDEFQKLRQLTTISPKITRAVRYARTIRNRQSVDHLLQSLRTAHGWDNGAFLVLISEPRLSMSKQQSFTSNDIYCGDEFETRFLGTYSTDQMTPQEILADIIEQI